MFSENISTNSQKTLLTILKNEGVSILRRISQCASCSNTLSLEYHLVGAVSYSMVGHCVDSVNAFWCSAAVRIIYQKPSPFRTPVRWDTFALCPSSSPPSNSICMGKYLFPEYKHHLIQRFSYKWQYLLAVERLFPLLLSQQWTNSSCFDTDT